MNTPLRVISLGAGVQSSAMLLMALEGRFGDVPDAAVFSDTQCEPQEVYDWLLLLEAEVHPFPIIRCSVGNLGEDYLAGRRRAAIPAFSTTEEGETTMMSRFCSKTYKVEEIMRQVRKLGGRRCKAESWIGISTDEAHRGYKPSGRKWLTNRYPLLDNGIHRRDCIAFVEKRLGLRPPKSSCVFCPYHGDSQWINLKANHPEDFAKAVAFDEAIRNLTGDCWDRPRFLHRSLRPLREVEFMHENQGVLFDGFGNECEGVCGV
ncbi:MAG: hypothetical protein ACO1SV_21710 [Fimbriimonas sp.]